MLKRLITLPVGKYSFFLFGPRQTGKTTLINSLLNPDMPVIRINLLITKTLIKYKANPSLLHDEIEFYFRESKDTFTKLIVFIDEIQKLPILLDEAHHFIEKYKNKISFIFSGSSARKLKKVSTNLLAGRAWTYNLFSFSYQELKESFYLNDALLYGTLPPLLHMDPAEKKRTLEAYTTTYLKEEILNEAVIRNLTAFSKFLEIAANCNGEIVNYSTIARDTGVASKTIKEYYQILEDTLIAFQLNSYSKSIRKQLILHPKYYFFDPGIVNSLCGRINLELKQSTYLYGQLFEHFIILELQRLIKYYEKSWKVYFWKTIHKAEVDVIIEIDSHTLYAVEIKSALYVTPKDLRGLKSFKKHFPKAKAFCVLRAEKPYAIDDVSFLPWKYFFEEILGLIS